MHLNLSALEAGLDDIRRSRIDDGKVGLIADLRENEREVLTEAHLGPRRA